MNFKGKTGKSRPTIKDVAAAANVSRAAVSLVLSGGYIRIGEEKRKRIITIAKEMGYSPHVGARRLAIRRMETLGLVLPTQPDDFSEYNLFELTHAIAMAAREHNYDLLLHFYDVLGDSPLANTGSRTDGSILMLSRKELPGAQQWLVDTTHPHVVVGGGFYANKPENYVDMDVATGLMVATRHLIQLGHRRIAYISHSDQSEKLNGYIIALTKARLSIRKDYILDVGFTDKALHDATVKLQQLDERPTGLVFTSDAVAIRMMRMLREAGFHIPRDFSMVGFGNIETASFTTPGLTTVRVPTRKIADLAVRHLVGLVESHPARKLQSMLPAELVVRESTAPVAG